MNLIRFHRWLDGFATAGYAARRNRMLAKSASLEREIAAGRFATGPLPRLHVYTLCRNEHDMIPWFVAHYNRFAERIVVYDNESTDDSVALLGVSSPKVEVRTFSTNGECNDPARTRLRNSMWKESKGHADLVLVCDMDEFLHHPRMEDFLRAFVAAGKTVLVPRGAQMASEVFPEWKPGLQLTDVIRTGVVHPSGSRLFRSRSKWCLFDPNAIEDMRYGPGCHTARPKGRLRFFASDSAMLLHYDFVGRDRIFEKMRRNRDRLAPEAIRKGVSGHYLIPESERLRSFERLLALSRPIV